MQEYTDHITNCLSYHFFCFHFTGNWVYFCMSTLCPLPSLQHKHALMKQYLGVDLLWMSDSPFYKTRLQNTVSTVPRQLVKQENLIGQPARKLWEARPCVISTASGCSFYPGISPFVIPANHGAVFNVNGPTPASPKQNLFINLHIFVGKHALKCVFLACFVDGNIFYWLIGTDSLSSEFWINYITLLM